MQLRKGNKNAFCAQMLAFLHGISEALLHPVKNYNAEQKYSKGNCDAINDTGPAKCARPKEGIAKRFNYGGHGVGQQYPTVLFGQA